MNLNLLFNNVVEVEFVSIINVFFVLVLWTILAGFLYITWTQRIWPEIRVDAAKPSYKPVEYNNPEVFTASELQDIIVVIRSVGGHHNESIHPFYEKMAFKRPDTNYSFLILHMQWQSKTRLYTFG